jgi:F-type H+-transporting ATPase subunit c
MGLLQLMATLVQEGQAGLIAIGAGLAVCTGTFSAIGEGLIACHAIDAISRNPSESDRFQKIMILAIALDESTGIYALITAMIIIFVLGA